MSSPLSLHALGEPIPGYKLLEPLGKGGFGEVWRCEAPGGLVKALKVIHGRRDQVSRPAGGLEQELDALSRVRSIRHPFLLSLERIEVVQDALVLVMELADHSLHERFRECQAAGLPGIPRRALLTYLQEA